MGYRRLFIVRKDLHMSAGKMSAQLAHCAECSWLHLFDNDNIYDAYEDDNGEPCFVYGNIGIRQAVAEEYIHGAIVKTICQARNKKNLLKARDIAESVGLVEGVDFGFIYDKCLTELQPEEKDGTTVTAFWTAPIKDEIAHTISKKYHLYVDDHIKYPEAKKIPSDADSDQRAYIEGWNDCLALFKEINMRSKERK